MDCQMRAFAPRFIDFRLLFAILCVLLHGSAYPEWQRVQAR
jgi:hypothetical protein